MVLTPDELIALTKRTRPLAQRRVLERLGIDHRAHPFDGTPIVSRAHAEEVLGPTAARPKAERAWEPDWSAFRELRERIARRKAEIAARKKLKAERKATTKGHARVRRAELQAKWQSAIPDAIRAKQRSWARSMTSGEREEPATSKCTSLDPVRDTGLP